MQNIPYGADATESQGSSSMVAQGTGNPKRGCSRGVTENASNEGKENNAGFALVIRKVAEPGGASISYRPVRGVLCYVWRGQWRKGELRHMISTRGCLHLDGVLRLGGTFDSAGFLVFYTLAPWVDRFSHPSRELPTRGGGCPSAGDVRNCHLALKIRKKKTHRHEESGQKS